MINTLHIERKTIVQRSAIKKNLLNLALLLISFANVLDLFVPRMEQGNYFVRLPIQLINGAFLLVMCVGLIYIRKHWQPVTKAVGIFILLIILYALFRIAAGKGIKADDISPYLKLLTWTTAIIFFYEYMLKYGVDLIVIRAYIITFIVAVFKKILEASIFETDRLGVGDTISLPLLFVVPLILLFFDNRLKFILLGVVFLLILFSLRRTSILGLAICTPFIYRYISKEVKTFHLIILFGVFVAVIAYAWNFIGDAIIYRFSEIFEGRSDGSYGSGRSDFYAIVWNAWTTGDWANIVFGNGLTSVRELLMRTYGIEHAHNDFLEIAYTFGLVGVVVWLYWLITMWKLRKRVSRFFNYGLNIFYIVLIAYGIIALTSGCILRATTLPLGLILGVILYKTEWGKMQDALQKKKDKGSDLDLEKPIVQ